MNDSTIGDDGLTDEERAFLQTPVSQIDPGMRSTLVQIRDKKAAHAYAENERYRKEKEAKRVQYKDTV